MQTIHTRSLKTARPGRPHSTPIGLPLLWVCSLLGLFASPAFAWTRQGHMITAMVAYEDLKANHPQLIERIVELMLKHPDRGTFVVAIDGANGELRERRLFMEMARWPDDIRGGAYDHPNWHYASRPVVDARHPPAVNPGDQAEGVALEAIALNAAVVADTHAPDFDRAVALCWLFHLVGDIHQPLHAATGFSDTYPQGDQGGNREFVLDPQSKLPINLHAYWDDVVKANGNSMQRAQELRTQWPRAKLPEITGNSTADFAGWARESYTLARTSAYTQDLKTGTSEADAPALSADYAKESTAIAERRIALSGYRLADILVKLVK